MFCDAMSDENDAFGLANNKWQPGTLAAKTHPATILVVDSFQTQG
jgi:hypothetical protein